MKFGITVQVFESSKHSDGCGFNKAYNNQECYNKKCTDRQDG